MATRKTKKRAPAAKKALAAKPAPRRAAAAPIRGMHAMFYSSQADALRAFLRDKLGLKAVDVGGGWLIFDAPEADLGVHPTEGGDPPSGTADVSFYCDDLEAAMRTLQSRGVEFDHPAHDHGYGWVTHFKVPGGFSVQLYQPKYRK
jgi:catechol 2,3-dioxygenase-like lactoylglutathione lyase family enzyme